MARISYSQFSQWVQCPHKWKLQYIDGYGQFTDNIYTMFGSSIHECIQLYLKVMYSDSIKKANELPLEEVLMLEMKKNYLEAKDKFEEQLTNPEEMKEFYHQGCQIIDDFKKKRGQYFSKKGYELVGIEKPLNYKLPNNINFVGFMDVVMKDTIRDRIKIIDIKTSTMGWNKWMKADKNKTNQLLLYKQFYSKQYNFPIDKIDVEFFIVKRKLYENMDFPQKRIQTFVPANGTPSLNKVNVSLKEFIDECFTDEGKHNEQHIYKKIVSTKNCKYCDFKDKPELCDRKKN
jgi:hypothetical protein|tara:strand:+ start:151 stop:1017 length:867 start_codon:yes stop_codon:yes gene_type:complete